MTAQSVVAQTRNHSYKFSIGVSEVINDVYHIFDNELEHMNIIKYQKFSFPFISVLPLLAERQK